METLRLPWTTCMYVFVRMYGEVRKPRITSVAGQSGSVDNWNITHAVWVKAVTSDSGEPRASPVALPLSSQPVSLLLTVLLTDSLFLSFDFAPLRPLLPPLCLLVLCFCTSCAPPLSQTWTLWEWVSVVESGYRTGGAVPFGLWVRARLWSSV